MAEEKAQRRHRAKVAEARAWLDLLNSNTERLRELTEQYPAYLSYGNRAYVLETAHSISELREQLVGELSEYEAESSSNGDEDTPPPRSADSITP